MTTAPEPDPRPVAVVTGPGARTANTDEQFDAAVERQALRRRLTPEDTAAAVAFLASEGAAALTGQVLCADGGVILR
jgi:3-oxoacyl-[acyl-carrier protein] reductase